MTHHHLARKQHPTTATIMDILRDADPAGASSREVYQRAHDRGVPIPRGSVRTTICMLYRDGVLTREQGGTYRIAKVRP